MPICLPIRLATVPILCECRTARSHCLPVFTDGFDFSAFVAKNGETNLILTIATTALAFCMVDMFDTLGTLYAACERANLLDEKGEPINMNRGMLSDAIATTVRFAAPPP